MCGHVARTWDSRGAHSVLLGKHEGNRLPGRPRRRLVDNIKVDF